MEYVRASERKTADLRTFSTVFRGKHQTVLPNHSTTAPCSKLPPVIPLHPLNLLVPHHKVPPITLRFSLARVEFIHNPHPPTPALQTRSPPPAQSATAASKSPTYCCTHLPSRPFRGPGAHFFQSSLLHRPASSPQRQRESTWKTARREGRREAEPRSSPPVRI